MSVYNPRSHFAAHSPFIAKVRTVCAQLRLSKRTEQAYVHWICDFLVWAKLRNPKSLNGVQVAEYLSVLVERNLSPATVSQAESALKFAMRRRKFRDTPNLLTKSEAAAILNSIPAKYLPLLEGIGSLSALRKATKEMRTMHANSAILAIRMTAERSIGRGITPNGFFHSQLLHEIADGLSWVEAEKKYGVQKVRTACADFVRQFPKVIIENLA